MSWLIKNCFFDSTNDGAECYMRKDNIQILATDDYFLMLPDFDTVSEFLLKTQRDQVIDDCEFKITSMNLFNGRVLHTNDDNIVITLGSLVMIFEQAGSSPHFIWQNIAIPDVAGLKLYIERFEKLKAFL